MKKDMFLGLAVVLLGLAYWAGLQDGMARRPKVIFSAPHVPELGGDWTMALDGTIYLRRGYPTTWRGIMFRYNQSENRLYVDGNCPAPEMKDGPGAHYISNNYFDGAPPNEVVLRVK